jgi:hypothetical protein
MLDFGGQSGIKASLSPSTSVFPALCHRTIAPDHLHYQGVVTAGEMKDEAPSCSTEKFIRNLTATAGRSDK